MGYEKTCDHEEFELTCWQCQEHGALGLNQELNDLRRKKAEENRWGDLDLHLREMAKEPVLLFVSPNRNSILREIISRLATSRALLKNMKGWRADVTVACGHEGGAHFEDVPGHVAALRDACRFVVGLERMTFAECSDAEAIVRKCKQALGMDVPGADASVRLNEDGACFAHGEFNCEECFPAEETVKALEHEARKEIEG